MQKDLAFLETKNRKRMQKDRAVLETKLVFKLIRIQHNSLYIVTLLLSLLLKYWSCKTEINIEERRLLKSIVYL